MSLNDGSRIQWVKRIVVVRCSECKRELRGHPAKGGDGTEWHPFFHKNQQGQRCVGSFLEANIVKETTSPS